MNQKKSFKTLLDSRTYMELGFGKYIFGVDENPFSAILGTFLCACIFV